MFLAVHNGNFEQEVLQATLPVLVNIWAPWCGVCRVVNPVLSQFQAQTHGQYKIVTLNADHNLPIANAYRITTLPTLLVFYQGEVCNRIEGFRYREHWELALEEIDRDRPQRLSA
jgi:thioredoxin 1